MDQRHQSAINVLREQQARQLRQKAMKQEAETMALIEKHEAGREELDKVLEGEEVEMDMWMEERRRKMSERWRLATEIWKKGRVDVGAIRLPHPIAAIEWPEEVAEHGEVRDGSGSAAGVQVLADL